MRTRRAEAVADRLHDVPVPGAATAEDRAWHVVRAAHAGRVPAARVAPRWRLTLALAAAVLLLAVLALTPAGAAVGDWFESVVRPGREDARPALTSLPAPGRLLVQSDTGPWILKSDGARRLLPGGWREASWSPNGLYVVAARPHEVAALDPHGTVHWIRPRSGDLATPRWSPDGFRVAYRSGRALHVVWANNDRHWVLARRAGRTAPAWQPNLPPLHQALAYAAGSRVRIVEVDSRRTLGRTPPEPRPSALWWARDGRRLVAVAPDALRVHDAAGRLMRTIPLPRGLRAQSSALAYDGLRVAVVARARRSRLSRVLVYRVAGGSPRLVFGGTGRFTGLSWSTDGQVLALAWPEADQWLFLRPGRKPIAVANIARRFSAEARPAGWCYPLPATRPPAYSACSPPAG
jgi:WD40-like Beta Propeller Repeat